MNKDVVEETQHELDVAVSQALRWFDKRHHQQKVSKTSDRARHLYLDFRHLVISHGIDVDELSTRIRAKVPSDVPIHMSLKCCRMDDGGLEVMETFLRNLPNVTFINVTWLWFDYCEISEVVQAATQLKELELPFGNKPGIGEVLRACSACELEDLRFHSCGSSIEAEYVSELLRELPLLNCLKTVSFLSFECNDECFEVLAIGLMNLRRPLEKLQLSCVGGLEEASLPILAKLIRGMPAETQLSIRIRETPALFQNASRNDIEQFLQSVQMQRSLKWLELDHVGMSSTHTTRLFRSLEAPKKSPSEAAVVSLCGPFLLHGKSAFGQLLKSIPRMRTVECLAVIDTHCNLNQVLTGRSKTNQASHDELVTAAVHGNPELQHLSLLIGDDSVFPSSLDEVLERNASLATARETISNAFTERKQFPVALWPRAMETIAAKGGKFGADPVYLLLEHLFATLTNKS